MSLFTKIFGTYSDHQIKKIVPIVNKIDSLADKNKAITIESVKDGLKIYENSVGVLTNSPDFNMQIFNLNNYAHISQKNPDVSFSESLPFYPYSRGLGGLGLPGDFSSMSRFVRAVFAKLS